MLPDYRSDNPYQELLAVALKAKKTDVHFPWGYRRILPIFRMATENHRTYKILHLHWISPYLKGTNLIVKSIYNLKFLLDVFLTRLAGLKIVWTVHNKISHDATYPGLEKLTRYLLCKIADRIILHNYSVVHEISHDYGLHPSKIKVIPHGHFRDAYPIPIDQIEAREELGLPTSGIIYLNQGMIRPYKGVEKLIQLWTNNPDLLREHTLLIAGQPWDETYRIKLQDMAKGYKNLHLKLEFIKNEKMAVLFSAANVIVLPLKQSLTSGSLLTAMSFGKPVIAPKLGGIPETLGKADALLYDPNDPEGLAKALHKSTEIDLEHLGQLTAQECDRLDWQEIAQKTKLAYVS